MLHSGSDSVAYGKQVCVNPVLHCCLYVNKFVHVIRIIIALYIHTFCRIYQCFDFSI